MVNITVTSLPHLQLGRIQKLKDSQIHAVAQGMGFHLYCQVLTVWSGRSLAEVPEVSKQLGAGTNSTCRPQAGLRQQPPK